MNNKKILITGASGFLGKSLLNELCADEDVTLFALSSHPEELQKSFSTSNLTVLYKDAIFNEESSKCLSGAIVINCAFPRNSSGLGMADGLKYIQNVFETSVKEHAKAIINISSQSVYSAHRTEPATEDSLLCLATNYAVGKYATELLLESVCRCSNVRFTNIRMASLIGPNFDQRIVNRIIQCALKMEQVTVRRNNQHFSYLDVSDAVSAILAVVNLTPSEWSPVYNVGWTEEYSLIDILETIQEVFHEKALPFPKVVYETSDEDSNSTINSDLLRKATGYYPTIHLKESVEKILNTIHTAQM